MSNELTVLNNNTAIQGGVGIDTSSKLFKLKPATLTIVQPNSSNGTKGNLRIADTGDEFPEMNCSLLVMPQEHRSWYIGEAGELNRTPENLMCFSTDMVRPHAKAKMPQAVYCQNCPKADWGPYREYKEQNGKALKALIPPCDAHYVAFLIDTVYQLPLKMYIRSKSKGPFEQGMQNVARTIAMAKAQKKNPNIYDVKFKLSTKFVQDGKFSYYVPVITEPKLVTEEERQVFGAMYESFTAGQNQIEAAAEETGQINKSQDEINKAVEGEYLGDDKEITI